MNGFTVLVNSYKTLLEQGKIDEDEAAKAIRVYAFLETCDEGDLCLLIDSSAFNDIIRAYCEIAIERGGTTRLFDDVSASDALKRKRKEVS